MAYTNETGYYLLNIQYQSNQITHFEMADSFDSESKVPSYDLINAISLSLDFLSYFLVLVYILSSNSNVLFM